MALYHSQIQNEADCKTGFLMYGYPKVSITSMPGVQLEHAHWIIQRTPHNENSNKKVGLQTVFKAHFQITVHKLYLTIHPKGTVFQKINGQGHD